VKISKQRALILMAFGVGAGLLSGMFGLGGGIIIVPGLMFALGMDQRRAHGTSLGGVSFRFPASFRIGRTTILIGLLCCGYQLVLLQDH
jgi:uncharacterized membrane protein YfcA